MKVVYLTLVYGSEYIKLFMEYTIPSLIKTNNRKAFIGAKYYIYTDNKEEIMSYATFKELSSICDITFKGIPQAIHGLKITGCLNDIIKTFVGNIVQPIGPDCLYSGNAIINSLNKIKEGYDACLIPTGALRANPSALDRYSPTLTSDEFSQMYLDNMHIETKQHFEDSNQFIPNAVMKIKNNSNACVVNSFYYQPLHFKVKESFDFNNCELNIFENFNNVYIFKNSDEYMFFDITGNKFSGWEGIYNKDKFLENNKNNVNRISSLCFDSGFEIKGKYDNRRAYSKT